MTTRIPERRLARINGRARVASGAGPSSRPAYLSREPLDASIPGVCANLPDGETERRKASRIALNSEVLVRRIGGFTFSVALKDISVGGCRVELLEPGEIGDTVVTRLPRLEPLGARVRWAEGTITGVQFRTTIHPAVFDMLLARLSPTGDMHSLSD